MNKGDLFSGLFFIGFGLFIAREASKLKYYYEHGPGPGFLPFWLGALLLILAFILVVMNLFFSKREKTTSEGQWWKSVRAVGTWAVFLFMISLMNKIGFLSGYALFTIVLISVVDRKSLFTAVSVSIGTAIGFYLVFMYGFGLRLPVGPWGF